MLQASDGTSHWCAARWDDPPGFADSVLVVARHHARCSERLRPDKLYSCGGLATASVAGLPAVLVAAEVALFNQALMPSWKEILLEDHEVRALPGTRRQVVTMEPNSGVASACSAECHECALLDWIERVQPAVKARVKRFLCDCAIGALHVL